MKTYWFYNKNNSCNLTLSAPNDSEAEKLLEETVKNPNEWRMEVSEEDDDD